MRCEPALLATTPLGGTPPVAAELADAASDMARIASFRRVASASPRVYSALPLSSSSACFVVRGERRSGRGKDGGSSSCSVPLERLFRVTAGGDEGEGMMSSPCSVPLEDDSRALLPPSVVPSTRDRAARARVVVFSRTTDAIDAAIAVHRHACAPALRSVNRIYLLERRDRRRELAWRGDGTFFHWLPTVKHGVVHWAGV